MLTKLKHAKNSKQTKKSKRILYIQPQNYPEQEEEQQAAINAKNYLFQLNKDEDGQYEHFIIKQKSELDISLSQWSNLEKNDYRLSERYPKSISIHVNKLDQRKISTKQFSSIEMSLLEQEARTNLSPLRKTYLSQFMKCSDSIRTNPSPQQIKIKRFSSNIQPYQVNLPTRSRVVSFVVKQQKTNKLDFTPKIDISYVQKGNSEQKSVKNKQKLGQNRNRLPRLDHLQSQQQKNKYKSIFRVNNRKNIMLVPMHSPISKDLSKIDDLIREESIKLFKKPI